MRKDLQLDDNNDLVIANNDLVIADSDEQHVQSIVQTEKGDWKESPFIGFGAWRRLKAAFNKLSFKRDLTIELESDGYKNPVINIDDVTNEFTVEI